MTMDASFPYTARTSMSSPLSPPCMGIFSNLIQKAPGGGWWKTLMQECHHHRRDSTSCANSLIFYWQYIFTFWWHQNRTDHSWMPVPTLLCIIGLFRLIVTTRWEIPQISKQWIKTCAFKGVNSLGRVRASRESAAEECSSHSIISNK